MTERELNEHLLSQSGWREVDDCINRIVYARLSGDATEEKIYKSELIQLVLKCKYYLGEDSL